MYRNAALTKRTFPTLNQLKQWEAQADLDDERSRDVRPLMSTLMRVASDPRTRGHITTRRVAVTAFGWSIVSDDPADEDRIIQVRTRLKAVIAEILQAHTQSVLFDVMCIGLEWRPDPVLGQRPFILRRYKPTELEKVDDFTAAVLAPTQDLRRIATVSTQETSTDYIVDISDDDDRGGLMRSIAEKMILGYENLLEWSNYNRKLKGILQGIYKAGADDAEIKAAQDALQTATKNNYLLTSDEIEFRVNEIVKGSSDSFEKLIGRVQADTCIAILGQANTAEIAPGSGSRAALEVLNLIRADIHYDDMDRVQKIVNDQLLLHDYRLNYDPNAPAAPWRFQIDIPEEENRSERVSNIVETYTAGIPLVASEAYRHMGMQKPDTVPDVLQKSPSEVLA
ncbi:MAG TPA: DUF935 family protein [Chlorobiota bacterium]|nr:DUF935 family protein [Chlorobiota bacterium]